MRRVKHILTYVLVLSMCFTLFFFPCFYVKAEADNVINMSADTCYHFVVTGNGNNDRGFFKGNSDLKLVYFKAPDNSNTTYNIIISQNSFNFSTGSSCPANSTSLTAGKYEKNGYSFYYYDGFDLGSWSLNYSTLLLNDSSYVYPIVSGLSNRDQCFEYAYDTAFNYVDPTPTPMPYGRVSDVEYATRIAGSGLASADNIDRIVWNQSVDSNGNDLPTGARVQIRAIPGKYVGNTANDVLTKTYTDFVLDHSKQFIIVDIIASRGVYETKWSEVVDHFGFFPYSWVPNIQYLDNEYFKMGWIYQIRLQVDDYYSDWQNIYTATGSGASESQTITDSDELTQQLVQDINIVNQLNNTTTTNWYINETTINNSEYTENTNGKPWWAYLLEAILSLFQIGDGEQQTINNTNNLNIDLNDKLNDYNEIEDQQLQNLDTNLDAIEVESDMLENNKFIGSANWVSTQYNRMTNGTVIGSLIGFSLLFGLALIFIGKIR